MAEMRATDIFAAGIKSFPLCSPVPSWSGIFEFLPTEDTEEHRGFLPQPTIG